MSKDDGSPQEQKTPPSQAAPQFTAYPQSRDSADSANWYKYFSRVGQVIGVTTQGSFLNLLKK